MVQPGESIQALRERLAAIHERYDEALSRWSRAPTDPALADVEAATREILAELKDGIAMKGMPEGHVAMLGLKYEVYEHQLNLVRDMHAQRERRLRDQQLG